MSTPLSCSPASRESFLEKKILILDKRLTLVEKFIDLRFRREGSRRDTVFDDEEECGSRDTPSRKQEHPSERMRIQDVESTSSGAISRKRQQEEMHAGGATKKYKPGPASSKKKKMEECSPPKSKHSLLPPGNSVKDCVVRVAKIDIVGDPCFSSTPLPSSSSGRQRRAPKRFQDEPEEENYNSRKTRSGRGRLRRDQDEEGSVVKVEDSDVARVVEHFSSDGSDDYEGLASPVGVDDDGEGGGYFTFPSLNSPPRSVVGGNDDGRQEIRTTRKVDKHYFVDESEENNDDDVDWQGEDDAENEEDDVIDEMSEPETKESASGNSTKRRKRGPYNKPNKKGEYKRHRSQRRYVKYDLTELSTDLITNADPSLKLCHLCNRHFKVEVYEAHLESHAKERHLKCPQCGKCYFNQFILKKHMRVHDPEKYAKKCRQCSKQFLHSDKLLAHERWCVKKALEKNAHVDPELIEDLKKRSKTDTSWIEEAIQMGTKLASSDNSPEKRKLCPHCKKNFKVSFYERHIASHTKPKNWSCNTCDKAYHYKHDLMRHVTVEHVVNPTCEFCQKLFEDRAEYKIHVTTCRREHKKKGLKIKNIKTLMEDTENDSETQESGGSNVKVEHSRGQSRLSDEDNAESGDGEDVEVEIAKHASVNAIDDDNSLSNQPTPTLGLVRLSERESTSAEVEHVDDESDSVPIMEL